MHLGNVKTAISSIRAELGQAAPPLFVGGNAFASDASLWIQVGADGYARDASQAIVLVRDLQT
jgi:methanogenic corrinoid protein MtbC1